MPTIETPFNQFTTRVKPEWIDYNGHMNVGYYLVAFDLAVKPFLDWLGLTEKFKGDNNTSTFALETHLHFVRELIEGAPIRFETRLIDHDHKRFHFYQEMYHAEEGYLAATHESIGAYIDMTVRKTAPMPASITTRLEAVLNAHQTLERPWQVGHTIGIKK
jgi:acyl-CoA thioester hydrolase